MSSIHFEGIGAHAMECPPCAAVADRLGSIVGLPPYDESRSKLWKLAEAWDYARTRDQPLFDSDPCKAALVEARAIRDSDPEAAYRRIVELANAGSITAMEVAAYLSLNGIGIPASRAEADRWDRRAAECGSHYSQLYYGKTLAARGDVAGAEAVLEKAVFEGWAPALFWVAYYRLKRARTPAARRKVRPMLEQAADQGSPAAQWVLAHNLARGRFGVRFIPLGARKLFTFSRRMLPKLEAMDEHAS